MKQAHKTLPLKKAMNTLFNGDVNTLPDLFANEGETVYEEELIIQVTVKSKKGSQTVEMKTGAFTKKEAEKSIDFALNYCREVHGKPLAWNWKGENVIHTPVRQNGKFAVVKEQIKRVKFYFGIESKKPKK